jgi:hypothetical protein
MNDVNAIRDDAGILLDLFARFCDRWGLDCQIIMCSTTVLIFGDYVPCTTQ